MVVAVVSALLVGTAGARADSAANSVSVRDARILIPADAPRFVSRAVEDFQKVVFEFSSRSSAVPGAGSATCEIELKVASETVAASGPDWHGEVAASPEAFRIDSRTDDGSVTITITGSDAAGLKFGIIELICLLQIADGDVCLPLPLRIARKPLFATRGMYAHLHWAYNHPYALRSWHREDWERYLDLLTHLGFNTVQIWPMMELLPHPLSAEDRAYLERYAAIVDYAHNERGMKVFIGSCPNSITENAGGVPIAEREYRRLEKRLNPGDPAALQRILEARSDLYRAVPDADGYWVIDSDPGGWPGSPPSDFVSILVGHRALIDRHGSRPASQPLIYWMWYGWGPDSREANWRRTLTEIKQRLTEPWRLHVCLPEHFGVCRELGVLDRATYFPYNLVETEPSAPLTELRFEGIDAAVRTAREAGLDALQGNAQTPLVQLPNIARLSDAAWQDGRPMDGTHTLRRLAGRLVAKDAAKLVRAWESLGRQDAMESLLLAGELRRLADEPDLPGSLGILIGDWSARAVEDLSFLLEIHAHALRFERAYDRRARMGELAASLGRYLQAVRAWAERTGYHDDRIIAHAAYKEPVARALQSLEQELGAEALEAQILRPASRSSESEPAAELERQIIETLLGRRK